MRVRITEYLEIETETKMWHCQRCGAALVSADRNYKEGCLVYERDPREVHNPRIEGFEFSFAPDPDWCRIIEFYCPACGTMVEVEYLPPGHPVTFDIELDIETLPGADASRVKGRESD